MSHQNDVPLDEGPADGANGESMEVEEEVDGMDGEEEEWGGIMDVDDEDDLPDFFKEEGRFSQHWKAVQASILVANIPRRILHLTRVFVCTRT